MVYVGSDVARLRRVIIHRPGLAHERMLPHHIDPNSTDYLLFDDLVHVQGAQREHDQLRAVLSTTAEVGVFEDMLVESLATEAARRAVLERVAEMEAISGESLRRLGELDPEDLMRAITAGAVPGTRSDHYAMSPLPNLLFTRDLAAAMGPLLVVGNQAKRARRREALLAWALVEHHPWFAGANISASSRYVHEKGGSFPLTIEGGDVLVMSDSLAVIGASERTTWSMVVTLARELISQGFTRVLVVEMPKQRSSMHLDTVFTLVDWDTAVVYEPILERGGPEEVHVTRLRKSGDDVVVEAMEGDFLDALSVEGHPLRAIPCGGGHPVHARREQWTDGANYVTLTPGVAVGYARNERTAAAMSKAGFRVLSVDAFLQEFKRDFREDFDQLVASRRRYAIQITGPELCRGRGGPRCLTLPLHRG